MTADTGETGAMKRRRFIAGSALSLALAGIAAGAPAQARNVDPEVVDALNRYISGIDTMQGGFVQRSPDGRTVEGEFYLSRPGRLRFEYCDPIPVTIFADGAWAGVVNRHAKTISQVPLSQAPLYILLRDPVDLDRGGAVRSVEGQPGVARVRVIDPDRPDHGSATMVFSTRPLELREWIITDAQGRSSRISLRNVRRGLAIDPSRFTADRN